MILFLKKRILLFFAILLAAPLHGSAHDLGPTNYAEAGLGVARGVLAAFAHHKKNDASIARLLSAATSVARILNEVLFIVNQKEDAHAFPYFWIMFDTSNLYLDLFGNNKKLISEPLISLNQENLFNFLKAISKGYFLPLIESSTTFYRAISIEQEDLAQSTRRLNQAFCSLARASSIFLNNQESKAALVLLIGCFGEAILALKNYADCSLINNQIPEQNQLQEPAQNQTQEPEQNNDSAPTVINNPVQEQNLDPMPIINNPVQEPIIDQIPDPIQNPALIINNNPAQEPINDPMPVIINELHQEPANNQVPTITNNQRRRKNNPIKNRSNDRPPITISRPRRNVHNNPEPEPISDSIPNANLDPAPEQNNSALEIINAPAINQELEPIIDQVPDPIEDPVLVVNNNPVQEPVNDPLPVLIHNNTSDDENLIFYDVQEEFDGTDTIPPQQPQIIPEPTQKPIRHKRKKSKKAIKKKQKDPSGCSIM